MKIAVASDMHCEMRDERYGEQSDDWLMGLFPSDADIIVLAGDCAVGQGLVSLAERVHKLTATEVLVVAGNHEYYYSDLQTRTAWYKEAFSKTPNIHFLERDCFEVDGYHFLGCTLWTGFECLGNQTLSMYLSGQAGTDMSDFWLIRCNGIQLTPRAMREIHLDSRKWLGDQLAKHAPDKTIVVTHFPPSLATVNVTKVQDTLKAYYVSGVDDLVDKYQPRLWIYGHNHYSDSLNLGQTHCFSNQVGYPGEQGTRHSPLSTVVLD
ncbi:hypothetical protein BST95_12705 [Halioglobus japonicus]|uniref:Calcineurin-like phosphoesterase domain-containing protein n=1 Tax=Halioglobus japonicus TaxID=930805 RepID=A0AAP8MHU1_9GAMM|nr:metallophosphoesterase [Halioglobus japonicus]AQA18975.1 hypothetical protein BST95_12705 [Halioglobus japonicus]PLW88010.1 hypothetical protein C0029_05480 [Halioglobus japonicus]GHD20448.1 phosphatase [Halioglobus japonicus]